MNPLAILLGACLCATPLLAFSPDFADAATDPTATAAALAEGSVSTDGTDFPPEAATDSARFDFQLDIVIESGANGARGTLTVTEADYHYGSVGLVDAPADGVWRHTYRVSDDDINIRLDGGLVAATTTVTLSKCATGHGVVTFALDSGPTHWSVATRGFACTEP